MSFRTFVVAAGMFLGIACGAARGADFDLSWHTMDGGGGVCSGGGFVLDATIGQPDAGEMSGGGFTLTGGFWAGATVVVCEGDVDGDGSVDLNDLAEVLSQFGQSGPGLGGDLDADGDVGLSDLAIVLANFGRSC